MNLDGQIPSAQARIAVLGGGFTGLVCALRLLQAGYGVTLLESRGALGGLAASQNFGAFFWDRFYHCILTSDSALLELLTELNLADQLCWTATEVGFFSRGALHTMTRPMDLLRYPHLSPLAKLRLALGTVYASRLTDGARLEAIPLEAWTRRVFGEQVYRETWEPLFRCKLGEMRHQASAAFLWGTLRRLYSTREKGIDKQERLGYVHGGYAAVLARLEARVVALGAQVRTAVQIRTVRAAGEGVEILEQSACSERSVVYDGAILTLPNHVVAACLETTDRQYRGRLQSVSYLGLICVVLVLDRPLSSFYVTNITERVPFTGIIEMTNLIDPARETAGRHLVYLPRYTSPEDPLFDATDDEVWAAFAPDLSRIHPQLTPGHIEARFVFRERYVQPVPTLHYSRVAPPVQTPVSHVYLANTAQIVNNTLNNNVMTTLAHAACADLMQQIPAALPARAPCKPDHPETEQKEAGCFSA